MMWSVEVGIQRRTEGKKRRSEEDVDVDVVVVAEEAEVWRLVLPMFSAIVANQRDRIAFMEQD